MPWCGYNFEGLDLDFPKVLSRGGHLHFDSHRRVGMCGRDTKLGKEKKKKEITDIIPNVERRKKTKKPSRNLGPIRNHSIRCGKFKAWRYSSR